MAIVQAAMAIATLFFAYNLAGYSGTPSSDDDDGFVYAHTVGRMIPNLSRQSTELITKAIQEHTGRNFDGAVRLYQEARHGQLDNGEEVDLFVRVPGLSTNLRLAQEKRVVG